MVRKWSQSSRDHQSLNYLSESIGRRTHLTVTDFRMPLLEL